MYFTPQSKTYTVTELPTSIQANHSRKRKEDYFIVAVYNILTHVHVDIFLASQNGKRRITNEKETIWIGYKI